MRGARQTAGPAAHRAVLGSGGLLPEKTRHLSGDGRIGGIRQTEFLQPGAALARGHIAAPHWREESFAENPFHLVAGQHGFDGAAHQAPALPQDGDGAATSCGVSKVWTGGKSRTSASRSSI